MPSPHDPYLLAHYRTQQVQEMARALGLSPTTVSSHLGRLVQAGQASYHERAYNPPWTAEEEVWLRRHIGQPGWSFTTAANYLHRTETAVRLKCNRLRIRKPVRRFTDRTHALRDVVEILGLAGNHRVVRQWIAARLLRASRAPARGGRARPWVIYPADLADFLQRHPECYDAGRIAATSPYRQYARRVDPTRGYLSMKQAARELGVAVGTLRRWRGEGRIAAEKLTGPGILPEEWWFRREVVAAARARRVRHSTGWMLPTADAGDWLTTLEAAARLGIHPVTLGDWRRAGRIQGERVRGLGKSSRAWHFRPAEVERVRKERKP